MAPSFNSTSRSILSSITLDAALNPDSVKLLNKAVCARNSFIRFSISLYLAEVRSIPAASAVSLESSADAPSNT